MPSAATATQPPSRRDEHKRRTARALQQAALDLFAKQGFDETTTDEISERAGVSPRTFFRYFATKESVLFVGEYIWHQSWAQVFLSQPETMSDVNAMRETYILRAPQLARSRASMLLFERAVASSPTLRGRVVEHTREDTELVVQAIATRRGLTEPDEGCRLLANVTSVTYRRALDRWLAGPASGDLAEAIDDEFKLLADIFATPVASSGNGTARARR